MGLNDQSKIGLGNRFKVTVHQPNKYDFGSWAKADGLDVTWEVPEYRMGDGWNSRLFVPANTKYTAIKLTRAVDKEFSEKVRAWLNLNATKHELDVMITIDLCDSNGDPVLAWDLKSVVVKKWAITTMDAGASQVAIETLELEHEGFLEDTKNLSV